jgi:hypothetical protein
MGAADARTDEGIADMRKEQGGLDPLTEARRRFLASCGKFAVATPPVVTLMLAEASRNYAVAVSGGGNGNRQGNNGFGNGGFDGVPGNSGNNKSPNAGEKKADTNR